MQPIIAAVQSRLDKTGLPYAYDLLAYSPSVLEKVSGNLKCYLEQLHDEDSIGPVG